MYDILPNVDLDNNICLIVFQVMFNAFIITNVFYFTLFTIYDIVLNIEYFIYGAIFSFVFITEYGQINREPLFKQLINNTFISTIRNKANKVLSIWSSLKSGFEGFKNYICRKSKYLHCTEDDSDEEPLVNQPSEVFSKTTYNSSRVEIKEDDTESESKSEVVVEEPVSESEVKEDINVSESEVKEDINVSESEVLAKEPVSELKVGDSVPEVPISRLIKDSEKYFKYIIKPVIDTNTDMD